MVDIRLSSMDKKYENNDGCGQQGDLDCSVETLRYRALVDLYSLLHGHLNRAHKAFIVLVKGIIYDLLIIIIQHNVACSTKERRGTWVVRL